MMIHKISSKNSESYSRTALTKGSPVCIIGTENVVQRVPHLVGKQGIIKDVPVHPATWVKVEFPDGSIATFRPSALKLGTEGNVNAAISKQISKEEQANANPSDNIVGPHSASKSTTLLSSMDPDLWSKQEVRIRSGHHLGLSGRIIGAGNGWVQVETSAGEIAKRAYELELMNGHEIRFKSSASSFKRLNKNRLNPRSGDSSESSSQLTDNIEIDEGPPRKKISSTSSKGYSSHAISHDKSSSTRVVSSSTDNSIKKMKSSIMEEIKLQHRRKFIQAKLRSHIIGSTAYNYWMRIFDKEILDFDAENQIQQDFENHYCISCYTEMWPKCSFCWNDHCIYSPMYKPGKSKDFSATSDGGGFVGHSYSSPDRLQNESLTRHMKSTKDVEEQCMNFAAEALLMMSKEPAKHIEPLFEGINHLKKEVNHRLDVAVDVEVDDHLSDSHPIHSEGEGDNDDKSESESRRSGDGWGSEMAMEGDRDFDTPEPTSAKENVTPNEPLGKSNGSVIPAAQSKNRNADSSAGCWSNSDAGAAAVMAYDTDVAAEATFVPPVLGNNSIHAVSPLTKVVSAGLGSGTPLRSGQGESFSCYQESVRDGLGRANTSSCSNNNPLTLVDARPFEHQLHLNNRRSQPPVSMQQLQMQHSLDTMSGNRRLLPMIPGSRNELHDASSPYTGCPRIQNGGNMPRVNYHMGSSITFVVNVGEQGESPRTNAQSEGTAPAANEVHDLTLEDANAEDARSSTGSSSGSSSVSGGTKPRSDSICTDHEDYDKNGTPSQPVYEHLQRNPLLPPLALPRPLSFSQAVGPVVTDGTHNSASVSCSMSRSNLLDLDCCTQLPPGAIDQTPHTPNNHMSISIPHSDGSLSRTLSCGQCSVVSEDSEYYNSGVEDVDSDNVIVVAPSAMRLASPTYSSLCIPHPTTSCMNNNNNLHKQHATSSTSL